MRTQLPIYNMDFANSMLDDTWRNNLGTIPNTFKPSFAMKPKICVLRTHVTTCHDDSFITRRPVGSLSRSRSAPGRDEAHNILAVRLAASPDRSRHPRTVLAPHKTLEVSISPKSLSLSLLHLLTTPQPTRRAASSPAIVPPSPTTAPPPAFCARHDELAAAPATGRGKRARHGGPMRPALPASVPAPPSSREPWPLRHAARAPLP
jgi:hypothetical protein